MDYKIMKFLIVDDNEQFRAYVRELLIKLGDECRELDNGTHVNTVYKEFHPGCVIKSKKPTTPSNNS
jgi:CheY-like chemotaxis protein